MIPLGFRSVQVVDAIAHKNKVKVWLNHNPFKEGEEVDIDTEQIRIKGTIIKRQGNVIIVKMETLTHKEYIA